MITFLTLYSVLLQLYSAALKYGLEALSRHCEILCVRKMHFDNCVMIYKNAKVRFSSQTNVATIESRKFELCLFPCSNTTPMC